MLPLELDHIFILVDQQAKQADLLVELGVQESFRRDHPGQGTSNRRFEFSNGMLEFLYIRDRDEARNGPGRDLQLLERLSEGNASPFGIIVNHTSAEESELPFPGWPYQPDYFPSPKAFHIGENSNQLIEPLCVYVPFLEPPARSVEQGQFQSITQAIVHVPVEKLSMVLESVQHADRLSIQIGKEHLLELTLDDHRAGLSHDFRPELPVILHW